jgi:hypothetical protein
MAGTDSRFNATKFRNGIRFAMAMGFPEDTEKQITWQWTPRRTFKKHDSGGEPFEWTSSQVNTEVDVTDMVVDCAVKFATSSSSTRVGGTALGIMDIASATVTLLDEEHDALMAHGNGVFPDKALMDGATYMVQITAPPYGLFEVTVYDVYLQAVDES